MHELKNKRNSRILEMKTESYRNCNMSLFRKLSWLPWWLQVFETFCPFCFICKFVQLVRSLDVDLIKNEVSRESVTQTPSYDQFRVCLFFLVRWFLVMDSHVVNHIQHFPLQSQVQGKLQVYHNIKQLLRTDFLLPVRCLVKFVTMKMMPRYDSLHHSCWCGTLPFLTTIMALHT